MCSDPFASHQGDPVLSEVRADFDVAVLTSGLSDELNDGAALRLVSRGSMRAAARTCASLSPRLRSKSPDVPSRNT